MRRGVGIGSEEHGCCDDACDANPVGDEIAFAAEEIGEGGPEERGDDADGRDAGGVVVEG